MKELLASFMCMISILICYFLVLTVGFYCGPLGAILAAIFLIKITFKTFEKL